MPNLDVLGSYSPLRGYKLTAFGKYYTATVQLTNISEPYAYVFMSSNYTGDYYEGELNKDEIKEFMQIDLVDDFIAHALELYQERKISKKTVKQNNKD